MRWSARLSTEAPSTQMSASMASTPARRINNRARRERERKSGEKRSREGMGMTLMGRGSPTEVGDTALLLSRYLMNFFLHLSYLTSMCRNQIFLGFRISELQR